MRLFSVVIAVLGFPLAGGVERASAQAVSENPARQEKKEVAPTPVAVDKGKAVLSPKNTTIQFVGTHVGPEPNPRTGYFTAFKGELAVDEGAKAPTAAHVEIEIKSLITPILKLTDHLQSPDFFDVPKFPKASFQSTKIEAVDGETNSYKVTGELKIRDKKKSIVFPAQVRVTGDGVVLTSKFKIKRSDFGMTFGPDRVVDDVNLVIVVGKPTPKVEVE